MSSLKSQSSLEYPQTHSPSFPLCPVRGTISQKRNRSLWFFSAQATWSRKAPAWLPRLGLNPSADLALPHHFQLLPQLATAASIPIFFQLYWDAVVSPGRCGPVVWRQPSPSSHVGLGGVASQLHPGLKSPPSPWLKAWSQLFNISMKPVKG